ncbi:hypothetical protein DUNSADRAFT_9016 [Dunaliella salina]|uniref:Uncharacterized protein n=1 Tax=Dunaliella salina TaxID=3046 RepID=A0ABQ7GIF8_DUNSA|nr:hypothetical protein DUNSADRAFT_9016 [Dunaliella salina]|eukprot:KAF5834353.1 hypothetical protein DUNSADRAFT_9016 [Dunaliella salina]
MPQLNIFVLFVTFLLVFNNQAYTANAFRSQDMRHLAKPSEAPSPPVWPEQFTAVLLQNRKNAYSLTELWYDFKGGRNMNLIQSQLDLKGTLFDLELDNKTSYYYNKEAGTCRTIEFPVGILRPEWLAGARYLGQQVIHNISTYGFTKADGFITYYSEVAPPHRPVQWRFFDGAIFDVLIWKDGNIMPEESWQIPGFCFSKLGRQYQGADSVPTLNSYLRQLQLDTANKGIASGRA